MPFNHRTHLAANLEALRLAFRIDQQLKAGLQPDVSSEERSVLAAYSGFGALKAVLLPPEDDRLWTTGLDNQLRPGIQQLHELLTEGWA